MTGIFSLANGWKFWLFLLITVNFFIPVYFYTYIEAQVTLIAFFAGGMIGVVLVQIQGFTRLLGLMHILWVPLTFYLIGKLSIFPSSQPIGLWIRAVLILNGISLLIDFIDVIRYVRGDRKPIGERT